LAIVVLAVSGLAVSLKPRESARLFRLEAKVDLLLKHTGLTYDPKAGVQAEVLEAIQRGEKIQAIKLYREATGVGLKAAKDYVEQLQASLKT
jgi:ribosomal protein L7/L12